MNVKPKQALITFQLVIFLIATFSSVAAVNALPSDENYFVHETDELTVGERKTVNVCSGEVIYFKFIPENTGTYMFASESAYDSIGYLYDEGMNEIDSNDDYEGSINFCIICNLTAGETYYFAAEIYPGSTESGSLTVVLTPEEPDCEHKFTEIHQVKEATCTEAGQLLYLCVVCGNKRYEDTDLLDHSYSTDWTVDEEPTCTTAGSKSHHCTRCDAKTDVTEIAKTEHAEVTDEAVAPTCTKTGLTEGKHCSVCGEVLFKQETVKATGHSYTSYKTTVKATCTETGKKTRTCQNCGKVQTKTISALGHSYSTDWTVDKAEICTTAGSKSYHCTRCDAKTDVTEIAKTGHSYTSKVTKKATCSETGVRKYTCSNCGRTYTKSISKLSHTYKTTTTKATTSKNGTKTTKCTVCRNVKSTTTIAKISTVKLSYTSYTYSGSTKKPTVTVTDSNGNKLVKDTDYTVKYASGRKNVGKYTVTVTFKGNYSGIKTLTFTIKPKGATISKLTAGTKKFTVKLNELPTQITGYQIQYSTSSKMTSATTKTYTTATTTSRTISSLKSAKTYYVRVRTYKTVDGAKIYSSWSSVKNVKIK